MHHTARLIVSVLASGVLLVAGQNAWAQQPAVASVPYEWKNVQIVGGGFVTGIIFHPAAKGVVYARTDMGGGYRMDPATGHWIPLTDFLTDYAEMGIESIAVDPQDSNRVYFLSGTALANWAPNGTLLRSDNKGDSWDRIKLPFKLGANEDGRSIGERLVVDPHDGNILYLGTRMNGLWKSTDHGTTWAAVASFPVKTVPGKTGIGILTFDARSGKAGAPTPTIYAAIAAPGTSIYRSTDAGASWSPIANQPAAFIPHHMELVSDGTLYITYGNAVGPNGVGDGAVWKLNTATGQWTDITPVKPRVNGEPGYGYAGLGVDASDPKILVVTTLCRWSGGDELWRSTDAGTTWKPLSKASDRDDSVAPYFGKETGHWIGDYKIDPFAPGHQLYVTGAGIWGTDNGNAIDTGGRINWIARAQGLEECAIHDLISPPKGAPLLSGMGDLGGFRHDDLTISPREGTFSNPKTNSVPRLDFAELAPDQIVRVNNKGWDGKAQMGAISSDGGATWAPFASTPPSIKGPGNGLAVAADASAILWIPEGSSAHRSTDRGATWIACQGLPETARWVAADRADAKTFYAIDGQAAKLYASSDSGANFNLVADTPGDGRLRATPGYAGDLWLPVGEKGLFHSSDGGKTFAKMPQVDSANVVGFGKAAPGLQYPAVYFTGKIGGVYGAFRSDDAGANWVRINDPQHHFGWLGFTITGDPRIYGRVYIGTNGRGVVYGDPAQK